MVLRSPGFARLSPQHRQDLVHAAGIQDPSPWVPGFPMEGGVNHPREFLKALVHGLSHMDAGALQATVGSLPEATQREIGAAFEFELMMTNVWDRKEDHALLQAGLDSHAARRGARRHRCHAPQAAGPVAAAGRCGGWTGRGRQLKRPCAPPRP
ncbi:hypothetical protein C8241_04065 [Paracidovorax avenae]|nr:hypothetical protein C8241_04065 [Paracidovorax avenae]